jgi:hypothetical protein
MRAAPPYRDRRAGTCRVLPRRFAATGSAAYPARTSHAVRPSNGRRPEKGVWEGFPGPSLQRALSSR